MQKYYKTWQLWWLFKSALQKCSASPPELHLITRKTTITTKSDLQLQIHVIIFLLMLCCRLGEKLLYFS